MTDLEWTQRDNFWYLHRPGMQWWDEFAGIAYKVSNWSNYKPFEGYVTFEDNDSFVRIQYTSLEEGMADLEATARWIQGL